MLLVKALVRQVDEVVCRDRHRVCEQLLQKKTKPEAKGVNEESELESNKRQNRTMIEETESYHSEAPHRRVDCRDLRTTKRRENEHEVRECKMHYKLQT